MSPGFIINYIKNKYHISITYNKAWNTRTKTMTKIFENWESSYETLPQYQDVLKASNPGIILHTIMTSIHMEWFSFIVYFEFLDLSSQVFNIVGHF